MAAATEAQRATRSVVADAASDERIDSATTPATDAAAKAWVFEAMRTEKRPTSPDPDILVTAGGRTYVLQAKIGSTSLVSAAVLKQATLLNHMRKKRRFIRPLPAAVTDCDAARTFTPR